MYSIQMLYITSAVASTECFWLQNFHYILPEDSFIQDFFILLAGVIIFWIGWAVLDIIGTVIIKLFMWIYK